ncbi:MULTISPECIES: MFS transporter [Idiomarina]|uniref:MFS transporter n=1 Tax=Idiomarina TaxID=135575 RepID=UPI00079C4FD0|nr:MULTISPECIES: MFS transporter [Idiomarina]KXS33907.1 MAG: major facilitator superfamily permease [Idiomarina sp. T82-3]
MIQPSEPSIIAQTWVSGTMPARSFIIASIMSQQQLNRTEKRAAFALASVFGIRMLGLFLIMPVMAIYAHEYPDYTPALMGIALGAYGLTQAFFQIPLGMLSDRIGRRPIIVGGLLVFALGSMIAAQADSLVGVVVGRAVQGIGAIAAAILAMAADVSRDNQRSKVMAIIGMCIGLAFALALIIGPLLADHIGLQGLFWFTAASALVGIGLLLVAVPKALTKSARREALPVATELKHLVRHRQLWLLNGGVFVLHAVLTSWFISLPTLLAAHDVRTEYHALFYLPTLVLSIALMVPMIIHGAKTNQHVTWFRLSILLLMVGATLITWWGASLIVIAIALVVFFTGFNFLEATLPSLLTRIAPAGSKGSASGIYSTCQFSGAFVGGALGGWLLQTYQLKGIGVASLAILALWFVLSRLMQNPKAVTNVVISLKGLEQQTLDQFNDALLGISGVEEVRYAPDDATSYLKVDKKQYDEHAVEALIERHKSAQ